MNPGLCAAVPDRLTRHAAGMSTHKDSNRKLLRSNSSLIQIVGIRTGVFGITCRRSKYNATGFGSLRPAQISIGIATSENTQKFGLKNATEVKANHTLRRREKSRSELKRAAIGRANRKTSVAIARTTTSALMLAIMQRDHRRIRTSDSNGHLIPAA